jgi:cobalt-zinc-cadmium efflux system outer membrane protein
MMSALPATDAPSSCVHHVAILGWRLVLPRRTAALVVLALAGPARAEDLTLAAARTRAASVGPPVALAERQQAVARAEVEVAGALANPTVSVQTTKETSRFIAGGSLPLPLFGQRGKAVAAARADASVSEVEREVARLSARWSATSAWVDLWAAQRRSELLSLGSADAARLLQIARERFDAGAAPRLDVVRATADRARADAEAIAARALIDAAGARLLPWVGTESGALPRAAGTPAPPALPPLGALPVDAHPLLRRDRAQVQAAGAHLALEQRLRVPVPSAEVSVDYQDRTNENRTDVIGGLSFELPVLSLRGGAVGRARAQQAVAETELALERRQLLADLAEAYHTTSAAASRWKALSEVALPAMEESRRMTEESYRQGRADIVRLLEAQRALLESRLAVLEAMVTWCHALADLERAAGVNLYAP